MKLITKHRYVPDVKYMSQSIPSYMFYMRVHSSNFNCVFSWYFYMNVVKLPIRVQEYA